MSSTPHQGTSLTLPADLTVGHNGEGDDINLTLGRQIHSWEENRITEWAESRVIIRGTPTELFELARRIDAEVALLVTAEVVPLDGAAFSPEVVEAAKAGLCLGSRTVIYGVPDMSGRAGCGDCGQQVPITFANGQACLVDHDVGDAFSPEVTEAAIEEVVDALTGNWTFEEGLARAAVRELVNAGGFGGYENFSEEVSENTAYQVAERMVEEGRIGVRAEAEDPADDELCYQPGRCRRHGVKMDTTPRGVGVGMSLTDDCGGREVKP